MRDCDAAIAINPAYADAYFNRGTAEMLLRRVPAALADANTAIDLNSGRPQYFQLTPQSG